MTVVVITGSGVMGSPLATPINLGEFLDILVEFVDFQNNFKDYQKLSTCFSKTITKTFLQYYFPVVNFYQGAGNFPAKNLSSIGNVSVNCKIYLSVNLTCFLMPLRLHKLHCCFGRK